MENNHLKNYLRRYTDLPSLLHILSSKQITLLDPKTWEDKNDVFFMSKYKERKRLKTLTALCFTVVPETYHHWHVFSKGSAGICIVFDRKKLLSDLNQTGISSGPMQYQKIDQARKNVPDLPSLPFLKRVGFKPEGEFRIIYESTSIDKESTDFAINLSCIDRVVLSPWLHPNLSDSVVKAIRSIDDCPKRPITKSSLISNAEWKAYGARAV